MAAPLTSLNPPTSVFVSFEGIDGSGKTTQARLLERAVREAGRDVLLVREPGGTPLGERIRTLLLDHELEIAALTEMLLFSAARAQLVRETIGPMLAMGTVVVCDRFYDSTTAYQGAGRGVADMSWLASLHAHVTGGLRPSRTYLIDLSVEAAMGRRSGREEGGADRMESEGVEFFERARQAYLNLAEKEPDRILILDGTLSSAQIHAQIAEDFASRPGFP